MSTYAVGDEMTLQAIARDAASTDPAQPHLDHYPRYYGPPPVPQGWQCPVCKTVYAPSVLQCWCAAVGQWIGNSTGQGLVTNAAADKEAAE